MSRLAELIQQYCPDGVEYKPLGEVCDIHKGVQFNKTDMKEEGSYPVINGGINPSGYVEVFNEEKETITISQGGASAGYVNFIMTRFWLGAHCYAVKPTQQVLNRYLYHFVKQNERTLQQCQYGAGIPALAKATIINLSIPVPPLPVQEEIVRILDNFTELQSELQSELQKRLQQYNYYRDNLLSFEGRTDVEWKKLGDVCDIRRGIRVVKKQLNDNGIYPVFQNSIPPMGYYDQYNREGNIPYIICAGSSSGSVGYCSSPFWAADDCFTIEGIQVNSRYAFHSLKKNNHRLFSQVRNGSMPRLPHDAIDNLIIPIPSLEEQERIANILDRFETLTTDITAGLPAEIEARRKQYEYYRDQLLTFKKKA